jgi:hypothetical protein
MAGLNHASIKPARASSEMSAEAVVLGREGRELQNAGSRTTSKVGPGAPQRPCASLGFDERNRLGFSHGFPAVLPVRSRQGRGQLEPDDLAANDGRRIHDSSVRDDSH